MKRFRRKDRLPHHGRGGSRHVGRVRIKLAKILSDCLELNCEPEELKPSTGVYRSGGIDCYAWEVFTKTKTGVIFVAGCFATMTECVKAGKVKLSNGEIYPDYKTDR